MREQQQNALNDALRLAHYGRPAFPCRLCRDACLKCNICKTPATPHGFKDATGEPEELRKLWQLYPGQLVGVPTGAASGLFVIDVDCGRHQSAKDWLESADLPLTRWHATASGGWHLLFKHRDQLRNSAGRLAPGVDTRGEGGYIIWWPFHLGLGGHKLDYQLAEVPEWAYEKLVERPRAPIVHRPLSSISAPSVRLHGLLSFLAGAHQGERNVALFWCANRVREMATWGELSESQFHGACGDLAQSAVSLGLPRREAERTIASAMRARS